jgi:hypothetical protein
VSLAALILAALASGFSVLAALVVYGLAARIGMLEARIDELERGVRARGRS